MSSRIRKTARAEADIRKIAAWIARSSMDAALKWIDDLQQRLAEIAEVPGTGTERSDIRSGLRSSPFGNYLIFFRPTRTGITIVRVIHAARDYSRFLR